MRTVKYLLIAFLALPLVFSCTDKKPTSEVDENGLPVFEFSNQDSTNIMSLANDYMTFFGQQNYEAASDMLYIVRNDSIFPLDNEQRNGFVQAMKVLPVYGTALKELKLYSDRDNELRIAVQVSEDGNLETEKGTINFMLNPVQVEGRWYLTLRDKYAEGVGLYH